MFPVVGSYARHSSRELGVKKFLSCAVTHSSVHVAANERRRRVT